LAIITREIIPNITASGAVRKHVKRLSSPKISDAVAIALVRLFDEGDVGPAPVITLLQFIHICAPSGFFAPHFGQYI
jgi:hypothetical protein